MEVRARHQHKRTLWLSVEPQANPRALALYQRLGFQPAQAQPYYNVWQFTDSDGVDLRGEEWLIDMWKAIDTAAAL